jgi:selenocysteine lyase/cysteine desulfurase
MEKLLSFLKSKNNVKLIGKSTHLRSERMPTVSFTVNHKSSLFIAQEAGKNGIGIRNGDFYAWRCLKGLGIDTNDGVIRISMVHYNSMEEVEKLIKFLEINI